MRRVLRRKPNPAMLLTLVVSVIACNLTSSLTPSESATQEPIFITATPDLGSSQTEPSVAAIAPTFTSLPVEPTATERSPATMADYWNGLADWVLELPETGLPIGESDTVYLGDGVYWSYLHASFESAGVYDSCGNPADFPGCVTLWVSTDGGANFELLEPQCLFDCSTCPCALYDHPWQQQYPRVVVHDNVWYMVYEQGASSWITYSDDGLNWVHPELVQGTGIWDYAPAHATVFMEVRPQLFEDLTSKYMAGGPPGIWIEGDDVYVFVGLGQSPGHMGCFRSKIDNLYDFVPCEANPLFAGASEYGPPELIGGQANAYYDHRFVTSADVIFVDGFYYMAYEGTRGRSNREIGREDQFSLGFARSQSINAQWEKFSGNPALFGLADNWGVGHADLLVVDGRTIMYTGTPELIRGRYALEFLSP